jgi:plastocyanin
MQQARTRSIAVVAAMVVLTLGAAACSSDAGDEPTPAPTEEGSGDLAPGSAAINIVDLTFEPTTITVASGSTDIAITNADTVDHTFTLDDDSVDQPVAAGENVTVTVDLSASVGFHCTIHPAMTGTLQVA